MNQRELISFMNIIEKLKCNTRHSWTSSGRHESVAEHSWRAAVMALLCREAFPDINIEKVVKMILIHDFGEAVTGDIPSFYKTDSDEAEEERAVEYLLSLLPEETAQEFSSLFDEMNALETREAKLYKSLDNMEGLISHNEAPISTWLPLEFTENLTYGQKNVEWSDWTLKLKEEIKKDAIQKMINEPYKAMLIPFKVENSTAFFGTSVDGNEIKFPRDTANGDKVPSDTAQRLAFERFGKSFDKWISLTVATDCDGVPVYPFATEVTDSGGLEWLDYPTVLEKLTCKTDKEALTELFYKPEPL